MSKEKKVSFLMAQPMEDGTLHALVSQVRRGLPTETVNAFIAYTRLDKAHVLGVMGISQRTLERKAEAALSPEQSDRLARIKRIYDFATEMIGDEERARGWLQEPNRALEGEVPLDLLDTDAGTQLVEALLIRISDGIFS
jgi:putative toxin-antitoxin system antitoxin component (TIGR02293 family)